VHKNKVDLEEQYVALQKEYFRYEGFPRGRVLHRGVMHTRSGPLQKEYFRYVVRGLGGGDGGGGLVLHCFPGL
jgi:hypothetical protein